MMIDGVSDDSSCQTRVAYAHTAYIVCGLPGSGKSTFGAKLAKKVSGILLDIDTCTETLVRIGLELSGHDPCDRDSPFFKCAFREPIYETMFAIASENLAHLDAVIVGPFTKEIQDSDWLSCLSARLKANVHLYYIDCDSAVRKERLIRRGNPRDINKILNWEDHCSYYGDKQLPKVEYEYVDNTSS